MLGKMMRVCGCVDCVDCVCGFCFFVEDGFVLENFIDWVNVWFWDLVFEMFDVCGCLVVEYKCLIIFLILWLFMVV